jgi:CRP/FNR family transcriptional activator FtrB
VTYANIGLRNEGEWTMALSQADANLVKSIRLFKDISDLSLPIVLKSASVRHFPARALLFNEGNRASFLHTLLHGAVELFSEHHDRRSTIAVMRSMKSFVLTSIVNDLNPTSARTLERSDVILVPLKVIHGLIQTEPAFASTISYEIAGELLRTIEDLKNHRLRSSIERLAEWILRCDEGAGGTGEFVLPYGKRILASHLGMAPENLSRNLASLASVGVMVRGRQLSFSDRAALAELARVSDSGPRHAPPLQYDPADEAERDSAGRNRHPALTSKLSL